MKPSVRAFASEVRQILKANPALVGAAGGAVPGAALGYMHGDEHGHGLRDAALGGLSGAALGGLGGAAYGQAQNVASTLRDFQPAVERGADELSKMRPMMERAAALADKAKSIKLPFLR